MTALDGRPTPTSRVGDFQGCTMEVQCQACGRKALVPILPAGVLPGARVGARFRSDLRFYEVESRLRCRAGPAPCGGPGNLLGVAGWKGTDEVSGRQAAWRARS